MRKRILRSEHIFLVLVLALFLYVNTRHNRSVDSQGSGLEKHVTFNDDRDVLIYNPETPGSDIPEEPRRYYDSKYYPRKAMRINVPTRGEPPSYQQVGLLQASTDPENVKPLYGRQTYPGSNQWNYFTSTDSHLATKIPLEINSQDCTDERGCKELQKNEHINVLDKDYKVNIYGTIAPRYIPY